MAWKSAQIYCDIWKKQSICGMKKKIKVSVLMVLHRQLGIRLEDAVLQCPAWAAQGNELINTAYLENRDYRLFFGGSFKRR
jgi:hypothetical protein